MVRTKFKKHGSDRFTNYALAGIRFLKKQYATLRTRRQNRAILVQEIFVLTV